MRFKRLLLNASVISTMLIQISGLANIISVTKVQAADSGFLSPTTLHAPSSWDSVNIADVQASDDTKAHDGGDEDQQGFATFGFNLPAAPAGHTVNGIEVRVESSASDVDGGCELRVELSWNNGVSWTAPKTSPVTSFDTLYTLGSPSDTWGRTWNDNELTNSKFAVSIETEDVSGNSCSGTASYDLVQARVTYEPNPIADLIVTKTNNVSGNAVIGNSFTWTLTVANNGTTSAEFNNKTILRDNLPVGPDYSPTSNLPVISGGVSGSIDCDISANTLVCEDNSGGTSVVIPAGGFFSVAITVTPDKIGTLNNPANGQNSLCRVDPSDAITEESEVNNDCSDTVSVSHTPVFPNPSLDATCGLDIALVVDESGSINDSELALMKSAMNSFVNAFAGTPTQFSVTKFSDTATVVLPFSADTAQVLSAINSIDGIVVAGTNWEDGLKKAQSTYDPRPAKSNLVVFASDGNPNRVDNGTTVSDAVATEEAIVVANSLKAVGTKIITLGIGGNLDTDNLAAISSASDVITSDFDTLASSLSALASELCGGTITITKLVDSDGDISTADDRDPASGWQYDISGVNDLVTTDIDGFTEPQTVDPGTYSVSEVLQDGYEVIDASCLINSQPVGAWQDGITISDIVIDPTDIVSCTFVNAQRATVTINKQVATGNADANSFNLYIGGILVSNGQTISSFTPGKYVVSEDQKAGYKMTGFVGDCYAGIDDAFIYIDISLGRSVSCTLINNKLPTLKLVKTLINDNGGTAEISDFVPKVNDQPVDWDSPVILEDIGEYKATNNTMQGYQDGGWGGDCDSEGNIILEYGQDAVCTTVADDIPPQVTVYKTVINDNSGESSASDFTINFDATNVSDPSFPGSEDGVVVTFDQGEYEVTEPEHEGYDVTYSEGCSGSLGLDEEAYCFITNNDTPHPSIEIEKFGQSMAYEGEVVTYTFKVYNRGDADLTVLDVVDDIAGTAVYQSGDTNSNSVLEVEEEWIYEASYTVPFGQDENVDNTVTVFGEIYLPQIELYRSPLITPFQLDVQFASCDLTDPAMICDTAVHSLDVIHPEISVVKSGPSTAKPGDTVTYTFTITNPGDIEISSVSVNDLLTDAPVYVSGDSDSDNLLDTDETWVYQIDYLVPLSQVSSVVNNVDVCGYDPRQTQICVKGQHTTNLPLLDVLSETITRQTLSNTGQEGINITLFAMIVLLTAMYIARPKSESDDN